MKRGDGTLKGEVRGNVALLLLFSAEMFLEIVHQVMKFGNVRRVGGLFALHGGNDDLMAELEFGHVGCFVRFGFSEFEALGEEVVEGFVLDRLCVRLLIRDPPGQLVGVF